MSVPSLGSTVGCGVMPFAHPGTGSEWYRVLYSPQIRNEHHQRASAGMLTSGELGQLLAQPWDVLPVYL